MASTLFVLAVSHLLSSRQTTSFVESSVIRSCECLNLFHPICYEIRQKDPAIDNFDLSALCRASQTEDPGHVEVSTSFCEMRSWIIPQTTKRRELDRRKHKFRYHDNKVAEIAILQKVYLSLQHMRPYFHNAGEMFQRTEYGFFKTSLP